MKNNNLIIFGIIGCLLLLTNVSALTWTSAGGCWTASDSSNTYVMWNNTGTYTYKLPAISSVSEYLVVAGGGSGGTQYGGGGGAGGVLNGTNFAVTPSSVITVVVGSGGAGVSVSGLNNGNKGNNSSFSTLVANGGGYGAGSVGGNNPTMGYRYQD